MRRAIGVREESVSTFTRGQKGNKLRGKRISGELDSWEGFRTIRDEQETSALKSSNAITTEKK